MKWNEIFDADHIPSDEDIREYLGEAKSSWDELTAYIEEAYQPESVIRIDKIASNLKQDIV